MAAKIRRNDEVIVIAGKNKNSVGKVLSVLTKENTVIVEGVNLVKRHPTAKPATGAEGGIITKEDPLH